MSLGATPPPATWPFSGSCSATLPQDLALAAVFAQDPGFPLQLPGSQSCLPSQAKAGCPASALEHLGFC